MRKKRGRAILGFLESGGGGLVTRECWMLWAVKVGTGPGWDPWAAYRWSASNAGLVSGATGTDSNGRAQDVLGFLITFCMYYLGSSLQSDLEGEISLSGETRCVVCGGGMP